MGFLWNESILANLEIYMHLNYIKDAFETNVEHTNSGIFLLFFWSQFYFVNKYIIYTYIMQRIIDELFAKTLP